MHTYKAYTASSILINYTIGVGILNLPKTVARASIIVSFLVITTITFLGYLLARYTVDAISRTFALKRRETQLENAQIQINSAQTPEEPADPEEPNFKLSNTQTYEFTEMCEIYFGKFGLIFYLTSTSFAVFGAIWSYTTIVAQSMASIVPFGRNWSCGDPCGVYNEQCSAAFYVWTYLAVGYTSVMIFFDLSKQKVIQVMFTVVRLSAIFIVAVIPLVSIFIAPFDVGSVSQQVIPYVKTNTPIFRFSLISFSSVVSSSIYAIVVHLSIPAALKPVDPNQWKYLNRSITGAFSVIYVLMMIVAFPSASYFGTDGAQLITLNFISWNGKSWNSAEQPIFYTIISYVVRLLPPIYVIGAMPIVALSMSNNLVQMAPKHKNNKYFVVFTKLFSIIPAGVLAGFFRCLGQIIDITGLFAFIIVLSSGVILLKSKKQCKLIFGTEKSLYSGFLDQNWVIWSIIVVFGIGFGFTLYGVIAGFL